MFNKIHHIAIIGSNYEKTKYFYTEILGLKVIAEFYRKERDSWKLDVAVNEHTQLEIFSFPDPPERVSRPEAAGLRHLCFGVENIEVTIKHLNSHHIATEPVRVDEFTGKRFTFFEDPDGLPLEAYEI